MQRALNHLYMIGLGAAAFFMVLMALAILGAIVGRFLGVVIPSADDVASFSMAASFFLALAATLRSRAHVRVKILVEQSKIRLLQRSLELWSHGFGGALLAYLSWHSVLLTWSSFEGGDKSPGLWGIPLWVPQIGMSMGLSLMAVACLETFIIIIRGGEVKPLGALSNIWSE